MSLAPSRGCLLDLPWEDILVPHVLCHLPLQQLLSLQRVSKSFQSLIQLYLANMRCFDSTQVSGGSEGDAHVGAAASVGRRKPWRGGRALLRRHAGGMGPGRRGRDSGPSNAGGLSKRLWEE